MVIRLAVGQKQISQLRCASVEMTILEKVAVELTFPERVGLIAGRRGLRVRLRL